MGAMVPTISLEQSIASVLRQIDQVEGVYVCLEGDVFNVFTVIDKDDEDAYDCIYGGERSIIRQFPNLHFDFNVIARRGRLVQDILGDHIPAWQRNSAGGPCHSVTNT